MRSCEYIEIDSTDYIGFLIKPLPHSMPKMVNELFGQARVGAQVTGLVISFSALSNASNSADSRLLCRIRFFQRKNFLGKSTEIESPVGLCVQRVWWACERTGKLLIFKKY